MAHTRALAEAIAPVIPASSVEVTASIARHAVGDRHPQMSENHPRVMGVSRDPTVAHRLRQAQGQTGGVGHLSQQRRARLRDQPCPSADTSGHRTDRLRCTFNQSPPPRIDELQQASLQIR